MAIDGIGDAAVGSEGEGGDVFVDGLKRLVGILGFALGQRATANDYTHQ
jgi:hypothetical protein